MYAEAILENTNSRIWDLNFDELNMVGGAWSWNDAGRTTLRGTIAGAASGAAVGYFMGDVGILVGGGVGGMGGGLYNFFDYVLDQVM